MIPIGLGAVDYLLDSECEHELEAGQESQKGLAPDYYTAAVRHGEAAGRWAGTGMEALGLEARAGQEIDEDVVRAVYGELRRPESALKDPVFLGRRPPTYKTEEQRYARLLGRESGPVSPERERELRAVAATDGRRGVAYYDFTFSAPKSVSVYAAALHAAGSELAGVVEAAHNAAVVDAIAFAESKIVYTRTGWHGRSVTGRESIGKHEAGRGLTVTTWQHSTSRANEPQLHTHAAVLNRTVTAGGTIGALDGAAFRAYKEAIDVAYTRSLEQRITEATGARFELRPDGMAREIVGIDPALMVEASTRRAQVDARVADLVAAYREQHGRDPGPRARKAMADMATLDTRAAKGPESGPSAVVAWSAQRAARLAATVDEVTASGHPMTGGQADGQAVSASMSARVSAGQAVSGIDRAAVIAAALEDLQAQYSVWTAGNLTDALNKRLGDAAALGVTPEEQAGAMDALVREALSVAEVVMVSAPEPVAVPSELTRADGGSLYRRANGQRYATAEALRIEQRVVAQVAGRIGHAVTGPDLELVRVEAAAAGLLGDQVDAVVGIVSSGRGGDILVGPAGAGKSKTVGHLARVWSDRIGGRVIGVATSQIATQNLAEDGLEAINTTRFLAAMCPDENGVTRDQLRAGDLVMIDEAGMSSRDEIAEIVALCTAAGAKPLLAGDHHQLEAIHTGGLFEHLVRVADPGQVHELTEVYRFTEAWEREASLWLREGDSRAVDAYVDRGRLHTGTIETMRAEASRAWLADTTAGLRSLLIVGSNDDAASLSASLRRELIRLGRVEENSIGRLAGGQQISVGDRVQARLNRYDLRVDPAPDGSAAAVTNRAIYTVVGRDSAGQLLVRDERGAVAHLPGEYVENNLSLAYAVTGHAAQGVTVDTGHPIADRDATREALYPAATRGRLANDLWLVTERAPDNHEPQRVEESARERLSAIIENSNTAQAASRVLAEGQADAASFDRVAATWAAVADDQVNRRYGPLLENALGPDYRDQIAGKAGEGRLLRSLREAELGGHDVEALIGEVAGRGLGDADSTPDVLRWRVRQRLDVEARVSERQVDPADWATWSPRQDGPVGDYLDRLAALSSQRQAELGRQTAQAAPAWAVEQLGPVPDAAADPDARAAWEARAGVAAGYRTLAQIPDRDASLGPAPSREREFERAYWTHARTALGNPADTLDYQALDPAALYSRTERWAREQAAGPRWVADLMRESYTAAHEHRTSAALRATELEALPADSPRRAELEAERDSVWRRAEWHAQRAARLEAEHTQRVEWAEARREVAEQARLAAAELDRRGLPAERAGAVTPAPGQIPPPDATRPAATATARPRRDAQPEPAPAGPAEQPAAEPALAAPTPAPVPDMSDAGRVARIHAAHARGILAQQQHGPGARQTLDEAERARRDAGMDQAAQRRQTQEATQQQTQRQGPALGPSLRR